MDLQTQINNLQMQIDLLRNASTIPIDIDQAFRKRFFSNITVPQGGTGATTLTGILLGNGLAAITAIVPLSGTKVYYVSDSSGGTVNRKLTFTNGVLTAET